MARARAWSLIALPPDARQYGGNAGYIDEAERIYRYDSDVANHRQLSRGDLIFIRDTAQLIGVARIESIASRPATKRRHRCPVCGSPGIKFRKSRQPKWRCAGGHEFDEPVVQEVGVTAFEARYERSFRRTPGAVTVQDLKAAALRPNDQLSIEEIDIARLERQLIAAFPALRTLIADFLQSTIPGASDAAPGDGADRSGLPGPFVSTMTDTREQVLRSIRIRRGQKTFRDGLIRRYGPRCLVSGCGVMDIVEASHLDPFRGSNDHHPDNGLLLRADLHTLFDLNLMGIDPDGFVIRVHPRIRDEGYRQLEGRALLLAGCRLPAREPVARRWAAYLSNLPPAGGDNTSLQDGPPG